MKKIIRGLFIILIVMMVSIPLSSCKDNGFRPIVYPQEFHLNGKTYVSNHECGNDIRDKYTIGDTIGYLINVDDEANFVREYPNVEYEAFEENYGKDYNEKYGRIAVYELQEYPDRSVVIIIDIPCTYSVSGV